MQTLTANILENLCGASEANSAIFLPALQACADTLNDPQRMSAFLANIGVESGGLSVLRENMNYTSTRLANVWPNRYAVNAAVSPKIPNALALQIGNDPRAIANNVYANRMGNGDESTGDGWNYRGGGILQITGKSAYAAAAMALDIDLLSNPDQITAPDLATRSALHFFVSNGLLALADRGEFAQIVQKINGQGPCPANQGELRVSRYQLGLQLLK